MKDEKARTGKRRDETQPMGDGRCRRAAVSGGKERMGEDDTKWARREQERETGPRAVAMIQMQGLWKNRNREGAGAGSRSQAGTKWEMEEG